MSKKKVSSAKTPKAQPVTPQVRLSPAELLKEKLAAMRKGQKVATTSVTGKMARPEVILDDEAATEARCFIPAKVCWDFVDAYSGNHKKLLETHLRDLYIQTMWAKKSQPENPAVKLRNDAGIVELEMVFVLQDRFSVQMPEIGDDQTPEDAMRELLITTGMNPQNAAKLVENELMWKTTQSISLDDEPKADDPLAEARTMARLNFVLYMMGEGDAPSREDFGLVLEAKTHKAEVRDGFLERAAMYAADVEELKLILNLIRPIAQHRGAKAWDNIDPAVRCERLIDMFKTILGDGGKPKK